ncbi:MAG TPA: coenzyme F420-0:L-glutamate ligase [Candidatus Brachybacterium merdavium]|uniref:Coenzyme F420-0:L-glutamate ligase n=1 Tax=Candidatus Brachybacterium merdavium TaxID=2838513 RepID=A0A9D2LCB2_9MICO|nr:coenzyme F420-0:L-glutamate ligase [Candidatus Brachybacterium merdavium]
MTRVEIIPVGGVPEVRGGDDLASLLATALEPFGVRDGDVLCISTKVVSKALGLVVAPDQREAAITASTARTVARRRHTRVVTSVVQIPSGPVMAAAGVDSSNAPEGPLLLPEDPDACAAELHRELTAALGVRLGVVLTDTSSRVWRVGVGDIALGAAGVASLEDLRGGTDRSGRPLTVTVRNLADELAAAADLVKGKADGVPLALVRGVAGAVASGDESVPARELSRTGSDDWFRRPSLESVWTALGLSAEQEPIARMSPEEDRVRIARAVEVALLPRPGGGSPRATAAVAGAHRIVVTPAGDSWQDGLEAGALAERLRTALGAESIAAPLPAVQVQIQAPDQQEDRP